MKKNKTDNNNKKISPIGGQALMEGVMMRGKSAMAMAVRAPEGEVLLETKRFKSAKRTYMKIPIIRGLVAFFVSMASGVSTLLKSAEVSNPEEEMPSKGWMGFAVVLGLALGIGLFILLPSFLASILFDTILKYDNILLNSLLEGVLRITIFVLYLLLVSRIKDIRRTFMYHGAEHRTINCYEKGLDMTVENVQSCSTRHNRCGTTFLFFVMIISILLFSLANYLFAKIGINTENYHSVALMFIKAGIRLALLPLVAGLSYELLKFLAFLPDNVFTAILRAPGLALQRLTTFPPDDKMAAIALASFNAVYEMDNDHNIKEVKFGQYSIEQIRKKITESLKDTNADGSEVDWILCDVLKVKRNVLHETKNINLKQYNAIKAILKRRSDGEPLWYILGYTDFFKSRILVDKRALIPRSETEFLCERVIEHIGNNEASVLDLCTGSGCIALAITKNTNAAVWASDISDKALELAEQNLKGKAKLVQSDMFSTFGTEKFDIIVSNPPYIKTEDLATLDKEVKDFEPITALDGGGDGLKFYRIIAEQAGGFLNNNGMLFLEIGFDEAKSVVELLEKNSFKNIQVFKDYSGLDRIVRAEKD